MENKIVGYVIHNNLTDLYVDSKSCEYEDIKNCVPFKNIDECKNALKNELSNYNFEEYPDINIIEYEFMYNTYSIELEIKEQLY